MEPRSVIIDCDPGQDDAVALLLALASPEALRVLGITCVAGNVSLDLTQRNARRICELAGRGDVPVFAGCPRPMLRDLVTAEAVHGKTGLDGVDLPDLAMPLERRHAVDFIIETCRGSGDRGVTLCVTGPMTNIAVAMVMAPEIVKGIHEIVFMGGVALGAGNTTPVAEFNAFVDPHALHIVLEAGVPLAMLGLDVTHKAITTPARLAAIRALGPPVGTAVADMLAFYDRHDIDRYGFEGGPLHDPCVIAYLLRPDIFASRDCHVSVEIESGLTMGQTVVDWWRVTGREPNCRVVHDLDADAFYELLMARLARLNDR